MIIKHHKTFFLCCLVLILCLILPCISACDPGLPLEVENKTGQVISIYVNDSYQFDVEPGKVVKQDTVAMIQEYYTVVAKNKKGEVVYSKKFHYQELSDNDWKVIISPP
jgi:hypothetical protein